MGPPESYDESVNGHLRCDITTEMSINGVRSQGSLYLTDHGCSGVTPSRSPHETATSNLVFNVRPLLPERFAKTENTKTR
jgi:hypothetical protein